MPVSDAVPALPLSAPLGEAPCVPHTSASAAFVSQPGVTYLVLRPSTDDGLQITDTAAMWTASFGPPTNDLSQLFTFTPVDATFQVLAYRSGAGLSEGATGLTVSAAGTSWNITIDGSGATFVDTASGECLTDHADGGQVFRLVPFKKGMGPAGPNLGHSVLFGSDGGLTDAGDVYEAYPLAAP